MFNANVLSSDGNWGDWSGWSSCSKTCGSGTQTQNRTCNKPEPANGGAPCNGSDSDSQLCNIDPCPIGMSYTRPITLKTFGRDKNH